ncbi:unnamed protein product [Rotaria sordida]|uniref:F-box domain-containing protein n=1 Tax=Rotaria sordida TaxID=392033 RepID=A0A819XHR5_9BILA|nr:unnamed protein product [Rotaria sordida]
MNSLSNRQNSIQLLDLPDELILAIINKINPQVLLLASIIGIGNNRLERLALDKCYSIDLSFYYSGFPYEEHMIRFLLDVMPRILNNIQSITINLRHLSYLDHISREIHHENLSKLSHLKIMTGHLYKNTGTPYTTILSIDLWICLGYYYDNQLRHYPLFSIVPQFFYPSDSITNVLLSFFHNSLIMHSIVNFEYDDDCALLVPSIDKGSLFPRSPHLTHVRVTLRKFDDCLRLLNQLGSQLCSFAVSIIHVIKKDEDILSQIKSISCFKLKHLTMTIYRNIFHYERCIIPLLQHLTNIEHLILLLAIGVTHIGPDHFIDGSDLQRDIISYMPHLRQLDFHIRSIVRHAPYIELDTIRQTFVKQEQSIDCALDYFNNEYGQCQIYSLPFIGTRLDFISNRFPLFDDKNSFSNITILLLFDDIKSFENIFFERLSRALPHLKTLEVFNQIEQEEKSKTTNMIIEFHHLSVLILHDIHVDYAEQLLCRSYLPCLIELVIRNNALSTIIEQNNQQARNNCSKVETLQIVEPWIELTSVHLKFFPHLHREIHDES